MWQISNLEASHSIQQAILVNFQICALQKEMYKWIEKGAKRNLTELWELPNKILPMPQPLFLGWQCCLTNITILKRNFKGNRLFLPLPRR